MTTLSVTEGETLALAEMFRLMGDASRLKIILACLDVPTCVSDIARRTKLSQSLVSHHLRLLRAARVLRAQRQGKQVFYAAADAHIRRVIADMVAHAAEPIEAPAIDAPPIDVPAIDVSRRTPDVPDVA